MFNFKLGGLVALFAASGAVASPLPQQTNCIPYPPVASVSPVWTYGQEATVTWRLPSPVCEANSGQIDVYTTSSYGSALYVATAASGFDLNGETSFTFPVPDLPTGQYFIMLDGWGNSSPFFQLNNDL